MASEHSRRRAKTAREAPPDGSPAGPAETAEGAKEPPAGADEKQEGYRWAKDGQTLDMKGAEVLDPSEKLRDLFVRFQGDASVNFHKKARAAINEILIRPTGQPL